MSLASEDPQDPPADRGWLDRILRMFRPNGSASVPAADSGWSPLAGAVRTGAPGAEHLGADAPRWERPFGAQSQGDAGDFAGSLKLRLERLKGLATAQEQEAALRRGWLAERLGSEGLIDWNGAWASEGRLEAPKAAEGAWGEALTDASWVPGPADDPNAGIRIEVAG
jgi:hypothetical protein